MPRSLSASVISELATNKINPIELVYIGVSTGYYYTDHYKDVVYNYKYIYSFIFISWLIRSN